jgi:hypothetical protein
LLSVGVVGMFSLLAFASVVEAQTGSAFGTEFAYRMRTLADVEIDVILLAQGNAAKLVRSLADTDGDQIVSTLEAAVYVRVQQLATNLNLSMDTFPFRMNASGSSEQGLSGITNRSDLVTIALRYNATLASPPESRATHLFQLSPISENVTRAPAPGNFTVTIPRGYAIESVDGASVVSACSVAGSHSRLPVANLTLRETTSGCGKETRLFGLPGMEIPAAIAGLAAVAVGARKRRG